MDYIWDFQSIALNWNVLAIGMAGTLKIFVATIVAGFSIGLLVGAARYSRNRAINIPAAAFVEFFRNTPDVR